MNTCSTWSGDTDSCGPGTVFTYVLFNWDMLLLPHWEYWAISGDIFNCQYLEEFTTSIEWVETNDVAKCPTMYRHSLYNKQLSDPLPSGLHWKLFY